MRASGPGVRELAGRVFAGGEPGELVARRAILGRVVDARGTTIDRGLALFFAAPHSYTGEDVLELHVHGSPAIARDTLLALLEAGARLAGPGEFTRRAFLGGKLDLAAAEAVADAIEAEHSAAARAAVARLGGGLGALVEGLRARLDVLLEHLAASLDFPDEVEEPSPADLRTTFDEIGAALADLLGGWERGRQTREGATLAIVGPPNAGKSSLLNALLGEERAIVSAIAGTTRDTIEEQLALDGPLGLATVVRAIDTAGLRESQDALEAAGMERSRSAIASATLLLVVVDGSQPLDAAARAVLHETRLRPRVIFFNKADLGSLGFSAREAHEAEALHGSAHDPAGIDAVRAALGERFARDARPDLARPHLGTARQADAALAAARALVRARATLDARMPVDLVASDVAEARNALGDLIGRDATESLLDGIFARFCIGK